MRPAGPAREDERVGEPVRKCSRCHLLMETVEVVEGVRLCASCAAEAADPHVAPATPPIAISLTPVVVPHPEVIAQPSRRQTSAPRRKEHTLDGPLVDLMQRATNELATLGERHHALLERRSALVSELEQLETELADLEARIRRIAAAIAA